MDFTQNERGLYTYAPTKKNTDFNYDKVLANLTAQGKSAMITTHKKAQWLGMGKFESKPLETGANPEDPLSYTIFSQHLYQQQARWGKTIQPLENIKTFTEKFYGVYQNLPLTGLGYNISQMPLNETNADWWTDAEYWTPKQLAACWSAVLDGHGGQIPLGGILNADPQAFIVFPSLAYGTRKGLTIRQYVEQFLDEFYALRPDVETYPFHAIGINFYARKDNKGIDPFDSELFNEFTWWKANYPLPIYLTEFGYDEIKPSKQCPDIYPNMDINQTIQEMFKRGILLAKSAGVDEFYQYMIRDTHPSDAGLYRTCGLLTSQQTGYAKKPLYHFFEETANSLTLSQVEKIGARSLKIDGNPYTFNADGTTSTGIVTPEPPQPTNMLKVSLSKSPFPDSKPLNGFTVASGTPLYIYIDGTKPPYVFSNGQREGGVPYEYKGGQSVTFPDGTHMVTVTDGSGVIYSATFTVGNIIQPAKEPVLEMWYEDGKIFYRTEKRVISNYAE